MWGGLAARGGFGIEQLAHIDKDDPSLFQFAEFKSLVNSTGATFIALDQCRFGGESTKPTWVLGARTNFSPLALRCNHGFKTFKNTKGQHYRSPHPRVYGEWVRDSAGEWQRKSATLAAYPGDLNAAIAKAVSAAEVTQCPSTVSCNSQSGTKVSQGLLWQ